MSLALLVFVLVGVALQSVTLVVLLRKRETDVAVRHQTGEELARMAVAYARSKGTEARVVRQHALDAFRLADERDGVRDFSERQAAVYVDAELARPGVEP